MARVEQCLGTSARPVRFTIPSISLKIDVVTFPDNPPLVDTATIRFLSRQMQEIRKASVRFLGHHPDYEAKLMDLLMAMGVALSATRVMSVAPEPTRRIGILFKGQSAVLTVDPAKPL